MTVVILETNKGQISIELDEEKAPLTAQNFINYVNSGFYNDTIFHRVIPGFMVQGGGLTADMVQKPTQAPVMNEANNGLRNEIGTIAMARTSDPHSATAQFFINVANNDFLNYQSPSMQGFGYCVFGKVIDGMNVVNDITKVNTVNRAGHENVPEHAITIHSARVESQARARSTADVSP